MKFYITNADLSAPLPTVQTIQWDKDKKLSYRLETGRQLCISL